MLIRPHRALLGSGNFASDEIDPNIILLSYQFVTSSWKSAKIQAVSETWPKDIPQLSKKLRPSGNPAEETSRTSTGKDRERRPRPDVRTSLPIERLRTIRQTGEMRMIGIIDKIVKI